MKKVFCVTLTCVLLLGLASCGSKTPVSTPTDDTTTTTTGTTLPPDKLVNPLTGVLDLDKEDGNRPVAIMVPNDSQVRGYQINLDKADFYMECETEGAIPRIMAVFANASRIPEKFGPIRSARSPFVTTAKELGFVLTFSGATSHVLKKISNYKLDNLNAGRIGTAAFWRDSYLASHVTNYHNLLTGGEKIAAQLDKKGFSTTAIKDVPFVFGEKTGTAAATTIQLNTTPSTVATFVYDSATGLYGKNLGKITSYKPHKTNEGNQLKTANVLVLYAPKFVETTDRKYTWYDFEAGSGTAYLFSGGTYRKLTYTRSSESLSFTEEDGSNAIFAEGKIYMVLADQKLESKQVIQ